MEVVAQKLCVLDPAGLIEEKYSALLLVLRDRVHPTPSLNRFIQWIDWHLGGAVSRYLLANPGGCSKDTIWSSAGRLATPFVVLQTVSKFSWPRTVEMCKGMQFERLAIVAEVPDDEAILKRAVGMGSAYPKHIDWPGAKAKAC